MNGENKRKHLEFIQAVISRMNTNSFLLKGWTVTIVAALFVLTANDSNAQYGIISFVVIAIFWILDGFFIATERRYRDLYNEVAKKDEEKIDFDMNAARFTGNGRSWISGIFSKTLISFYSALIVIAGIALWVLSNCAIIQTCC